MVRVQFDRPCYFAYNLIFSPSGADTATLAHSYVYACKYTTKNATSRYHSVVE